MAYYKYKKLFQLQLSTLMKTGNTGTRLTCQSSTRRLWTPLSLFKRDEFGPLPQSKIPGFKSFPLIGSSLSFLKNFDNKKINVFWEDSVKRFGPIIKMKLPFHPTFVALSDPEDIEKMFRFTTKNPIRVGFTSLKKVRDDAVDDYFQKKGGLLVENNEEWWRVRSKVQTPMMKVQNLVKYLPQMDEVTLQFMNRIATFQEKHGEMPSNFQQELYKWALESVSVVALNKRLGCLDPDLLPNSLQMTLINSANDLFDSLRDTEMNIPYWRIFPTKGFKKLKSSHDVFLRVADDVINQTVEALKTKETNELTLIETLLSTEGLTRKDVVTMILDMMFAGIDTTSHTVAFSLYCLAKNKGAQKKLQEEVDRVLGTGEGPMTEFHLARFTYMKLCVKEAMRLFPLVGGNVRYLEEDEVFSGYRVSKGVQLLSLNFVTSLDEKLFPRAKEYLPERWSRDKPYGPIHPFASLPFSYGPRMCIGRRIAEQEIYTFLARVFHRYDIDYKYADMGLVTGIVSSPSEPLRFEFKERRKQ